MGSQLSFICIRQHTFLDQKYVFQLFPTYITLNQIDKEPKYIIELELHNIISWQLNQMNQLISFSILWNNIEKQFRSTHEDLLKLRQAIKNKIMYKTVRHLYKPMQQLGEGNFDEVYLCRNRINGNSYEIKCLAKNQFEDSIVFIAYFTSDSSDYVQNLQEVFNGENTVYFIKEYLEGLNLYELIMNVPLDRTQILIIMKVICITIIIKITAVRDIHSSNIMHRDIKPTNIVFKNKDSIDGLKQTEFHLAVNRISLSSSHQSFIRLESLWNPWLCSSRKIQRLSFQSWMYCSQLTNFIFSLNCIHFPYKSFNIVTTRDVFPGKTPNEILRMNKICNIDFKILQFYKLTPEETDLLQQEIKEIEKNPEELQVDQESPRISAIPNFKVLKKDSQIQQSQVVRKSSKLKKSEIQEYTQLNFNKSSFQARNSVHQTMV
ncbi:unnamed protein product [Paramecium octaurelia]|uniref:Protein kinase domain-containing protein n=1 Tax=Paramecium octaurelia TaxID=43137 RepID=A0A8S1XKP5_PAROT|nr:unnamed protein product [Paramecium octaurelia]